MRDTPIKEITPLTANDCFTIFSRRKAAFTFPFHYHEEFELNFISNGKGAQRIIGDHKGEIDEIELVLVGSNLPHVWKTHRCRSKDIREVTIQFHKDLFDEKFLRRNQLHQIKILLEESKQGILFSKSTALHVSKRMKALTRKQGFDSVLELMSILHDLSVARNISILSESIIRRHNYTFNNKRIEIIIDFLHQNFDRQITLNEAAGLANMSEASFSRFFKQNTGVSFIEYLIEIRLGYASRLLIDSTRPISDVAYHCGFNNLSNFNRAFKRIKNSTPKRFREHMAGKRIFI